MSIIGNFGIGGCEVTIGRRRFCNYYFDLFVFCYFGFSNDCFYVIYYVCIFVVVLSIVEEEYEMRKNFVFLFLGIDVGSDYFCGV